MQPESGCCSSVLRGTPSQPHEGDGINHSINQGSESTYYVQDAGIMMGTRQTANKEDAGIAPQSWLPRCCCE